MAELWTLKEKIRYAPAWAGVAIARENKVPTKAYISFRHLEAAYGNLEHAAKVVLERMHKIPPNNLNFMIVFAYGNVRDRGVEKGKKQQQISQDLFVFPFEHSGNENENYYKAQQMFMKGIVTESRKNGEPYLPATDLIQQPWPANYKFRFSPTLSDEWEHLMLSGSVERFMRDLTPLRHNDYVERKDLEVKVQ